MNVTAADPRRSCPIACLDLDCLSMIAAFLAYDHSSDFVVCTAQTTENDTKMPVRALHEDCDVVLRGVPINGTLYITEVPDESRLGLRQDWQTLHPVAEHSLPVPVNDATVCSWFTKINRTVGGTIDRTATPIVVRDRLRHSFYCEATAPHAVKIHINHSEDRLMCERHDHDHLKYYTVSMSIRLRDRLEHMRNDEERRLLPIDGASTKQSHGQLTVLALCHGFKMKTKLHIMGKIPLMCRLDVPDLNDDLSTMTRPYNLKSQLSYSLGKWLTLIPAKWLVATQHIRRRVLSTVEWQRRVIPDIRRIRDFNLQAAPDVRPAGMSNQNRSDSTDRFLDRCDNTIGPADRHNEPMAYQDTSFKVIGPMMVFTFFSCSHRSRSLSLTSDDDIWKLMDSITKDASLRDEFSLTGPHVSPAGLNERLTIRKDSSTVRSHSSPELDLLGGVL